MGVNYALIMNRINYFSEHVLCSKTDKIVTDILEKPWNKKKKKIKSSTFGLVKKK